MSISEKLRQAIHSGVHHIGEIMIRPIDSGDCFELCHLEDSARSREADFGGLTIHQGPSEARDISSYAENGSYRFLKGQANLRRGWVMLLESAEDLRLALDQFYPACVGLWLAQQEGTLEVETLRDKFNRQTGMYRRARTMSNGVAQQLIPSICCSAVPCTKRILWQIDDQTPLLPSDATRRTGIHDNISSAEAIPLLCREVCNHFVAECLATAKTEATQSAGQSAENSET